MSTNISDSSRPSFMKHVFRMVSPLPEKGETLKKVKIIALSILIGIFAFIPRAISWFRNRKITLIIPEKEIVLETPSKNRGKRALQKTRKVAEPKIIPKATKSFAAETNYGEDAAILTHLTGHSFAKETSLEGSTHTAILTHVIDFLEKRSTQKISSKETLLKAMQGALQFSQINTLDAFQKGVWDLVKAEKPFLLPFGWTGEPYGHAMYLEVLPDTKTHCTLRIYNLGAGAQHHERSDQKQMPFLDWKGIELEKFTSDPFLEGFFEIGNNTKTLTGERTNYSEKEIYESFKSILSPLEESEKVSEAFSMEKWMNPQEAGICAWKSLAAFLATHLSKEEYKQLMAEIKVDSVYQFAEKNQALDTAEGKKLFDEALSSTARYIENQIQKKHLDAKYRTVALKKLKAAQKLFCEKAAHLAPEGQKINYLPNEIYLNNFRNIYGHKDRLLQGASHLSALTSKSADLLEKMHTLSAPSLKKGDMRFQELLKILEQDKTLWKEEGLAIHTGLFEFMRVLPLEEAAWKENISETEAKDILRETLRLSDIAFGAFLSTSGSEAIQPEQIYILRKLTEVQSHLNKIAFGLESGDLFYDEHKEKSHLGSWETPVDGALLNEVAALKNRKRELALSVTANNPSELLHSNFWRALKKECPDYVQALEKNNRDKKQEEMVAVALADDDLPDQFKASRNANIYLKKSLSAVHLKSSGGITKTEDPSAFRPKVEAHFGNYNDCVVNLIEIFGCEKNAHTELNPLGGSIQETSYQGLEKLFINLNSVLETPIQTEDFADKGIKEWASDETRALLRIFASDVTVHNDLLAYCKEHPGALFEPDFERLFIRALLKGKSGPQLTHLQQFLMETLTALLRTEELETSCFLLRALRYSYQRGSPEEPIPPQHFEMIEALKSRAQETPAIRLLYLEELSALSLKKEKSETDLQNIAKALCFLNHNPLNSSEIDPMWLFEIGKANLLVAKELTPFFEADPSRIQETLKVLDQNPEALTWITDEKGGFVSRNGENRFSPYAPRFEMKKWEGNEQFIAPKILENIEFQTLFPNVRKARFISDTYEFQDPDSGRKTRVNTQGEISQYIEGAWWIYTPSTDLYYKNNQNELVFLLGSAPLTFKGRHYRSESSKKWISEDPITHKILYRTHLKNKDVMEELVLEDVETKWRLSFSSKVFEGMAHPSAIEEWYDGIGNLQKCSLASLGLHFKKQEGKLYSEEIPGFFLDLSKPKISPIRGCPFGLVLENEKGEKKFLLPNMEDIKPPEKKKHALIPHFQAEFSLESPLPGEKKYHLYTLSKEGTLSTKSSGGELFLASIYTLFGEHKKAFEIVKKQRGQLLPLGENPALLKPLEEILQLSSITGNQSPEASALSLFAGLLILKNSLTYPNESLGKSVNLGLLAKNFRNYLKKEHHIHSVRLLKEEELFLIDHLDPEGNIGLFQERKAFLGGISKKASPPVFPPPSSEKPFDTDLIFNNASFMKAATKSAIAHKPRMITRPNFTKDLGPYYDMARNPSQKEQKWLAAAIAFAEQDKKERPLAQFLKCVLDNPEKFNDYFDDKSSRERIKKSINELMKPSQEKPLPSQVESKTPFSFFTPPKPNITKPLSFLISQTEKDFSDLIGHCISKKEVSRDVPDALKLFLEKGKKALSPLEKSEYARLKEDADFFELGKESSFAITDRLGFEKALAEKELSSLKEEILQIANHVSEENEAMQFLKLGGHIKTSSLEALLINFARQRPEELQRNNPSLTQKEIENLYSKIGAFLILATEEQQKGRVRKALLNNLPEEAASLALAKRAYKVDPSDKKALAYLTFEYFSDLLLRPEQVTLQKDFLENLEECFAEELIMGSGKSKVILILLALLRANGENISAVVVASPFFKDVALHSSEILQKTFEQTLATIHFDRGTPITVESLKSMLGTLESVKQNQDCLIVTSKTLQCLVLRFIEEWMEFSTSNEANPKEELKLLKAILSKIHTEGNFLIDELDTVLNVLHTVSFSMGKKERPKPSLLKINRAIYEILYTDPEIKKIARLESDPGSNLKAPPLTKELYQSDVRKLLAKKLVANTSTLSAEKNKEALIDFICQDPNLASGKAKKANQAYSLLSEENKELVSEAALQIGHLLEKTLVKTSNEKYGIAKGDLFAIPYSAANTPCKGSEFASHTVTFNYTLQFITKYGLAIEQIQTPLQDALKRAQNDAEGGLEMLLNQWEKKIGILFSDKNTDWKAIEKKINSDFSLKLEFFEAFILPKMEFYSEKITSNSQNIAEIAALMKGFTGTLWNAKTFHPKFVPKPARGTDTKTLALLFSHSSRVAREFETMGSDFDLLIDAGGYFKDEKNIDLAKKMAKERKMPVLFYHNNVQTITDGEREIPFKEVSVKEGEYLTFLDQVNTTGADTVQKSNAKAFLTIKAGMTRRDLFQAAWRLRGLAKGQTIDWVIDKKTASLLRSALSLSEKDSIGLPEILRYTIANEAEQLANDNYQACMQQIENVKQKQLTKELLDETPNQTKKDLAKSLRSSFCKPESASNPEKHFSKMPQMIKTKDYLNEQKKQAIKEINKLPLSETAKKLALSEIDAIIKRYQVPGMLLDKIQSPKATAEESVEIEKETERETEVEVEIAKETEHPDVKLHFTRVGPALVEMQGSEHGLISGKDAPIGGTRYLSFETYFGKHEKFQEFGIENAFQGISSSLNFLQLNTINDLFNLQAYQLHEAYQKAFDYVIFKEGKALLISQEEAEALLDHHEIYSLKSGVFIKVQNHSWTTQELEELLKIRFLAGHSSYNEEEIAWLSKWITGCPKLVDFFKETILKKNRERALEFRGSPLAKLFATLPGEV